MSVSSLSRGRTWCDSQVWEGKDNSKGVVEASYELAAGGDARSESGSLTFIDEIVGGCAFPPHLPNQQPFLFQGIGYLASPCVEEFVVPLDLGYLLKVAQFC